MSTPIKFYFVCISPWSYLAVDALVDVAKKHGRDIAPKPIDFPRAWSETGAGRPVHERPEVLQAYRLIELPRWAKWRGVPLTLKPKYFPTAFQLSSHVVIAARQAGQDALGVAHALMRGCWAEERDIGNPDEVISILDGLGLNGAALVQAADGEGVASELSANTDEALADGAWSIPSFLVDGELFFGQDRLEMIDWRLSGSKT